MRDAARNRAYARKTVKAAAEANTYMADADFAAAMAATPTPEPFRPEGAPMVAGQFGGSLQRKRQPRPSADTPVIPAEFLRNLDAQLADIAAGRKPKLA